MKNVVLRLSGAVFFLAGLCFFLFPYIYDRYAAYNSSRVMKNFNREIEKFDTVLEESDVAERIDELRKIYDEDLSGNVDKKGQDTPSVQDSKNGVLEHDVSDLSDDAKRLVKLYRDMCEYNRNIYEKGQLNLNDPFAYEKPPINLKDYGFDDNIVGIIRIDAMNVEMPLYLGASKSNMKKGAAVLGKTSMPTGQSNTNMVVAAHRGYRGIAMFRDIQKLVIGDEIKVTTPYETLVYKVVETKVILPDQTDEILIVPGKRLITLSTCHPYTKNSHRYLVFGELVSRDGKALEKAGDRVSGDDDKGKNEEKIVDGEKGKSGEKAGDDEKEKSGEKTGDDEKEISGEKAGDDEKGKSGEKTGDVEKEKAGEKAVDVDKSGSADEEICTKDSESVEKASFEDDERIMLLEKLIPVVGGLLIIILAFVCLMGNKRKRS